MSAIDELIAELCPDGVEYRKLGKVANIKRGTRVVKKNLSTSEGYPVFQNSLTPLGYHTDFNEPAGTPFVICAGAAGEIGYSESEYWAADDCYSIECGEAIDSKYALHSLLRSQRTLKAQVRKASIPRLSKDVVARLEIPVPPIEVQREIVRILDSFTELEADLEAELGARKAQYSYYRDRLLSLESLEALDGKPVEMVRLGDVCVRQKGMPITAAKMKELASEAGNVVVFGGGKTKVLANRDDLPKGNVIETPSVVVKSRGNIGFEYCDVPFTNKNELWSYAASSSNVDIKFIYHYLDSRRAFFQDAAKVGKLPQISTGITDDFQVSLPSLETQQKIVCILDRFDALTTSLTDGLPAEIEARKAQYGYYRDRLLDFPRKEAAAS